VKEEAAVTRPISTTHRGLRFLIPSLEAGSNPS
jgi:hypothetical protein